MPKQIWGLVNVGFWKETTRGTVVNPSVWLPKLECDFQPKIEVMPDESSFGTIFDARNSKITKKWSEGTIGGYIGTETLGLILLSLFGSVSSAQIGSTGVYTHSFSVDSDNNQHPSLSIHTVDGIKAQKFALCMIDSIKITIEAGKPIAVSTKWRGKAGVDSAATPSYVTDYLMMSRVATFKLASALAWLGAASGKKVKKIELEITKNLEDIQLWGDGTGIELDDITNDLFTVKGTIEAVYEDVADYITDAIAGTFKALRLTIEDTDVTIGSSWSNHPKLQIDLAQIAYTDIAKNMDNSKIMMQTLWFKGLYSLSDAQMIVASLQNTISSL